MWRTLATIALLAGCQQAAVPIQIPTRNCPQFEKDGSFMYQGERYTFAYGMSSFGIDGRSVVSVFYANNMREEVRLEYRDGTCRFPSF